MLVINQHLSTIQATETTPTKNRTSKKVSVNWAWLWF